MRLAGLLLSCVLTSLVALGCAAPAKDTKVLVNVTPSVPPAFSGTYDFDLLEPVVGSACVTRSDSTEYAVAIVGASPLGTGGGLRGKAEAAAMIDALARVPGADSILVTRTAMEGDLEISICARVWGRAVRLKKGPTIGTAPASDPGAKTVQPSPSPAPAYPTAPAGQ